MVEKLMAGLYLVSTPIGAARDITLRALDIFQNCDIIAAEDTRNTRRLLDIHGIALNGRRIVAYHDHNGAFQRPKLLEAISQGKSVAYASDAGTPLIADPGFLLGKEAAEQGLGVYAVPGASAILAALCVSGMPTDRFLFAGFPPNKQVARRKFFEEFTGLRASLIFYESPKRVLDTLAEMQHVFGDARPMAFCRELTKKFEQVFRGRIDDVIKRIAEMPSIKGECVLVLGLPVLQRINDDIIVKLLKDILGDYRLKDASNIVSTKLNVSRKRVYALGLEFKNQDGSSS